MGFLSFTVVLFYNPKSISMKTVLPPRAFCFAVLSSLLLVSFQGLAERPSEKIFTPLKKKAQISHAELSLAAPADVQVNTDPWSNEATNLALGEPLVTTDSELAYSVTNNAPASYLIGITEVIWTVTDADGNTATATQKVTVTDNEKPHISRRHAISVVNDPGQCGAVVKLMIPNVFDNSYAPVTLTHDGPVFFPVGSLRIIWTATDIYGNSDTSTQMITVIDNELPTISTTDIQVNNEPGKCGAVVNLGIPVTADNCGVVSVTNDAPAFFPTGTTLVHWTVTDKVGYTNTTTQTVVVNDTEKPVLSGIPANTVVTCGNIPAAASPVATDNCTASPVISFSEVSTQSSDLTKSAHYNYTITRTWVAKDAGNNTSTASQTITVQDKTAPVITVPANINVGNSQNVCGATVNFSVSASDNCGSPVTLTYSKKTGSVFSTGTTTVTVTAKDASGNTSIKSFTVNVTDTQKPSVTAPSDINTTVSSGGSKATVNLGTPVTSDNCGVQTVTNNAPSSYPVGTTTVTWTVKDAKGNTSTDTQIVTVTVKKKSNNAITPAVEKATEETNDELKITVAPNPSSAYFTLKLESRSGTPIDLRVIDASGRVIDTRAKLGANTTLQVGHDYMPGIYFAEFTQAGQRKVIQLMKIK